MTAHPDHLADASDDALARALVAAGRTLPYPEPDLAATITHRLSTARRDGPRSRVRRVVLIALVLLVLAAGSALAAGVGVPGIALRSPVPTTLDEGGAPLARDQAFLGRRVSLAEARAQLDFDIAVPALPTLGAPEVFVADQPSGPRVSLRFPEAGVLLTQFRAGPDDELFSKGAPGAPEPVAVGGTQGWWIEGPHAFSHGDGDDRVAGGVLVWARDGVTFRLESDLPRARAIAVAESAR